MAVRVIVAEPDDEQRAEFSAAVEGSPFEACRFTETNEEAVELYDELRPQVLVLTLVSGHQGAPAALDALREKNARAKALVSYTVSSTHVLMAAYAHGAASAIKKPFRLHRVVEKLTYAVASERHDKLAGPIVNLEHPIKVRHKSGGWFARFRTAFCERLGLTDMDLNAEAPLQPKARVKLQLLLPNPTGEIEFAGVVEAVEKTGHDNWCSYIALTNTTPETRRAIEAFLVTAAKRA